MLIVITLFSACTNSVDADANLKNEYDKNQLLVDDNLTRLDSIAGLIQNRDSFSMEKYASAVNQKDSLYKILDSLFARQFLLDSMMKKNKPS